MTLIVAIILFIILFCMSSKSTRYTLFRCCKKYGANSMDLYQLCKREYMINSNGRNVITFTPYFEWEQGRPAISTCGRSSYKILVAATWDDSFPEQERLTLYKSIKDYAVNVDDFEDFSADGYKIHDILDPTLNTPPNGNWVASIYDTSKSEFNHPIHGINGPGSIVESKGIMKNMHGSCSKIFKRMIPLFEQVLGIPLCWTRLKVYVKIKSITINGNGKSQVKIPIGRFHREGEYKQKIRAVGLYWIHVDDAINGGDLQLSRAIKNVESEMIPKEVGPNYRGAQFYYKRDKIKHELIKMNISAQQNKMIVFDNLESYHQVQGITVDTRGESKSLERTVVAFFLIDPFNSGGVTTTQNWKENGYANIEEMRDIRNKFRSEARKSVISMDFSVNERVDFRDFSQCGALCLRD